MKITTRSLFIILGLASFSAALILFSACSSVNKGLSQANETADNLYEAKQAAIKTYEAFKSESSNKIDDNAKSIAKLREDAKDKNEADKAALNKKLTELEQRNKTLKSKIKNYKVEGDGTVSSFILETTKEIDDIRKGIRSLAN